MPLICRHSFQLGSLKNLTEGGQIQNYENTEAHLKYFGHQRHMNTQVQYTTHVKYLHVTYVGLCVRTSPFKKTPVNGFIKLFFN